MMGRPSRDKGTRGELEVAHVWEAAGFDCARVPNSGGLWIPGDLAGVPGLHQEVKRAETVRMGDWWRQACNDAPEGLVPVVVWRSNREKWRVAIELEEFVAIYQRATLCP
jgi:hypothetical protein